MKPYRHKHNELIETYHEAFAKAIHLANFTNVFKKAFDISQTGNLKAADAIHAAFAAHYQCELFVTTDPDFRHLKSLPLRFIDLSQSVTI